MPRKNVGKKIDVNGTLQDLGNTLSDEDLEKLDGIEEGAQKNVQADWEATEGDSFIKNKPNVVTTSTSQTLYRKNFNQVTINVGTSSTASSTAIKVVTLSNFELKTGAIIDVKFSNGSYYDTGTTTGLELSLNVNSTGAKKIINYISSGASNNYHSKNQYKKWNAGDTVRFRYDGTYWTLIANVTSMTSYLAPVFRFPLRYNKSDGSSTYWYGTENLDLTHLLPSTVQYVSQTLTDAQKTQARTNIGAGTSNFSGNYNELSNKPTIPSVSNFITKDVNNLTNYTLTVDEASKIQLSMDNSNYILTLKLLNSKDEVLSTDTIDFPLETMVVSASYDATNKKIILTLKNGTTTSFSVADLVSGLVPNTRTVNGKALSEDITLKQDDIGDGTTYKRVTQTEKNTWNNKSNFSGNYNDLTNKPTIPDTSNMATTNTNQTILGIKTHTNGLVVSGRSAGGGDDEGITVAWASNGYAGVCLGSPSARRSVFYLKDGASGTSAPYWRYAGSGFSYDLYHPGKAGTIATTSDLGTQATFSLSGTTLTITPK